MTSSNRILPENAVWLVTGTSSGIGLSLISSVLSTPGRCIVVLSRSLSTISLPSTSNHSNTLLQRIDLASSTSIANAFNIALDKFGRIDIVINNAGYGLLREFESINEEKSRDLFEINYWAPVQITRHAIGIMRDVNPKTRVIRGSSHRYYRVEDIWALQDYLHTLPRNSPPKASLRLFLRKQIRFGISALLLLSRDL